MNKKRSGAGVPQDLLGKKEGAVGFLLDGSDTDDFGRLFDGRLVDAPLLRLLGPVEHALLGDLARLVQQVLELDRLPAAGRELLAVLVLHQPELGEAGGLRP